MDCAMTFVCDLLHAVVEDFSEEIAHSEEFNFDAPLVYWEAEAPTPKEADNLAFAMADRANDNVGGSQVACPAWRPSISCAGTVRKTKFKRQFAPGPVSVAVPEEPFPLDCLPLSPPVAAATAPLPAQPLELASATVDLIAALLEENQAADASSRAGNVGVEDFADVTVRSLPLTTQPCHTHPQAPLGSVPSRYFRRRHPGAIVSQTSACAAALPRSTSRSKRPNSPRACTLRPASSRGVPGGMLVPDGINGVAASAEASPPTDSPPRMSSVVPPSTPRTKRRPGPSGRQPSAPPAP